VERDGAAGHDPGRGGRGGEGEVGGRDITKTKLTRPTTRHPSPHPQVNEAAEVIYDLVDPEANLIFGAVVDPSRSNGELSITLIATGFGDAGLAGSAVAPFVAATPRAAQAAAPVAAAAPAAPAPKGALDIVVPAFLRRGRK